MSSLPDAHEARNRAVRICSGDVIPTIALKSVKPETHMP